MIVGDARTGEVIGAHIVDTKATEMIQELVNLRDLQGGYAELARIPHGHPTMSEAIVEPTPRRQRMAGSWLADLERLPLSGRSLAGLDRKQFDVVDRRTKRGFKSARVSMRLRE